MRLNIFDKQLPRSRALKEAFTTWEGIQAYLKDIDNDERLKALVTLFQMESEQPRPRLYVQGQLVSKLKAEVAQQAHKECMHYVRQRN